MVVGKNIRHVHLEECIEGGGEADDESLTGLGPGELGEEEQHLVVERVLQVLAGQLQGPQQPPGEHTGIESEKQQRPPRQPHREQGEVEGGGGGGDRGAGGGPAPTPHRHRTPKKQSQIQ